MPRRMNRETFDRIVELLSRGGMTFTAIGAAVGVSGPTVGDIAHGRHYYQADAQEQSRRRAERGPGSGPSAPNYLPTPEEIEAACERIRAARVPVESDETEGWTPPLVSIRELLGAA